MANITGTAGNDVLEGTDGDDVIEGLGGSDLLVGGLGADTMFGGVGNDVYFVDNTGDQVVENSDEGTDELRTSLSVYSLAALPHVENLTGIGTAGYTLTGNSANNVIYGGRGADTMRGGAGNDTYIVDNVADQVIENADEGVDDVRTTLASYTLGDNLERLTGLSTTGQELRGNALGNVITGHTGADIISGGLGDDLLTGGGGNDLLTGGAGDDEFAGTRAQLATDRITDFAAGDRIVVKDATLAGFEFALSGETLQLGQGASMTLSGFTGRLVASAAAEGGVALSVASPGIALSNDFNGDGRSDLFWREAGGGFSNWLGRADGGLTNNDAAAYKVGVPVEWRIVGSGDFNGDGRSDILWRHEDGRITDWLGGADGSIGSNDAVALAAVDPSWRVAGTGDFNGDGRFDILWRNGNGGLTDWLGRADGGFANNDAVAYTLGVPSAWRVAGTGDFNGDGRSDILWRHEDGRLTDWLGRTDGGFANNDATALTAVPTSWQVVGTGDFNGDGLADLLWRNTDGGLTNWLGRADGGFTNNDAVAYTATVPTSWHVADTGDYNGDGRSDILWRNDNGGLTTWLGDPNGGFINNDANAYAVVPTNWQVQNDYLMV